MKKKKLFLSGLIVLLVLTLVYFTSQERKTLASLEKTVSGDDLSFSPAENFHAADTEIILQKNSDLPRDAVIRYTLDGNDPTEVSALYSEPILFPAEDGLQASVVKAAIFFKGERGEVFTKTYFSAADPSLWNDTLVISVASDAENLYDYERGILAKGRIYDEFMETHDEEIPFFKRNANYNQFRGQEYEQPATVEIFDAGRDIGLLQNVGLTVSGGASSAFDMKSLKLAARSEYDSEASKLALPFPVYESRESSDVRLLNRFNKLILRNGGQDREWTYILANVGNRLAAAAGIPGTAPVQPALVFLNGGFYGIAQVQPSYSDNYLRNTFSLPDRTLSVYGTTEATVMRQLGADSYIKNLNAPENRRRFEQVFDADDLLLYYAYYYSINAVDWPHNNYKLWRYEGDEIEGNKYTDGRCRPLVYDLDYTFVSSQLAFSQLLENPTEDSDLLYQMVQVPEYRDKFLNYLCDIWATALQNDFAQNVVEEEDALFRRYMAALSPEDLGKTGIPADRDQYIAGLKNFFSKRLPIIRENITQFFGMQESYLLQIDAPSLGSAISWSSRTLYDNDASFTGEYYTEVPLTISCSSGAGKEFDYWLINGEKVYTQMVNLNDYVHEGRVHIRLIARENFPALPVINEISAASGTDWIEIYNPSDRAIALADYYLSDNPENAMKCRLPDQELPAGGTLVLFGKDSKALFEYTLNFNLKKGETLTLFDRAGDPVQKLVVPSMNETDSYGLFRDTGRYVFFANPTPARSNFDA